MQAEVWVALSAVGLPATVAAIFGGINTMQNRKLKSQNANVEGRMQMLAGAFLQQLFSKLH